MLGQIYEEKMIELLKIECGVNAMNKITKMFSDI
jgi:hypothetical protein